MDSLHLHQIPINLDEWAKLTVFLSCAEEGALMRAVRVSWAGSLRGETPGTLPDDDQLLARALGGEAEHVALVRRYFAPDGEGRLCWEWLAQLYRTALAKYQARQSAAQVRWGQRAPGSAAQPPRAGKSRPPRELCNADALHVQPKPNSSKNRTTRAHARAPDASLAAAGSRAAPAPVRPGPIAPGDEPTPLEVDAWVQQHPTQAAAIEGGVDAQLDEFNPRWRTSPMGGAIRTRFLRAAITTAMQGAPRDGPGLTVSLEAQTLVGGLAT